MRTLVLTRAVSWALLLAGVTWSDEPTPIPRELVEGVLVERARVPVQLAPQRCLDDPVGRLQVSEDGADCRVTAVETGRPPTVHALLIDNSGSMMAYLSRLQAAAIRYIEDSPEDEPVIVASFANNVILESSISTDREGQLAAVRDLGRGQKTALHDALYYAMRYLETRRERKVIILFTDTYDNASLGEHTTMSLLELAAAIPDLTIFTLQWKNPLTQSPTSEGLLRLLTERTGGAYFRVKNASSFNRSFRAIRNRLDSEVSVVYEPPAWGDGPRDREGSGSQLRDVRVSAVKGSRCRIVSGAHSSRLAADRDSVAGGEIAVDLPGELPAAAGCFIGRPTGQPVETMPFPVPESWPIDLGERARFMIAEPRSYLFGETVDIAAEPGIHYDAALWGSRELYLPAERYDALFGTRGFAVDLPPLEHVRHKIRTVEDVIERLLAEPECDAPGRYPMLIHGQTWIELRPHLAQAIYAWRDDYRSWADERIARDRERSVDELLMRYAAESGIDAETVRAIRETLRGRLDPAGPEETANILAEWLGDVPAARLATSLQERTANRMLGSSSGGEPATHARLNALWPRFRAWFPPPIHVRVLTPMIPAYDAERDRIGFYRIVAPRLDRIGPPGNPVPPRPFGSALVSRLLADDELSVLLTGRVRVAEIESRWRRLSGVADVVEPDGHEARLPGYPPHRAYETTVHFEGPAGKRLKLTGIHLRESRLSTMFYEVCLWVEPIDDPPEWATAIRRVVTRVATPCTANELDEPTWIF